jgi:glycine betaine/proline transport system substrate-binding protein
MFMNLLLRRFLVATLLALSVSGPVQAKVVAIGYVDLSCHEVTAELIKSVLERMGYNVSLHRGNAAAMFTKLAEGEIDLLVAAWLPHADAGPWLEHKDQLVKLSTLYDDARSFWAVPAYVPEAAVRSVADLRKTDVAEKMLKPIRVPNANLALLQGSTKIFAEYALRESGYSLSNGSTAEWMSGVKENLAAQKWFVLPLWRPHYLGAQFRVLEEPKQFLGGSNKAYLLASKDSKIDRSVVDLLKRMTMSNKAVADMDAKVFLESRTPHEAARYWMGEHPNTVEYWYTPDEADGEK